MLCTVLLGTEQKAMGTLQQREDLGNSTLIFLGRIRVLSVCVLGSFNVPATKLHTFSLALPFSATQLARDIHVLIVSQWPNSSPNCVLS